jgi:drug/metabolite transporter (DMT)-like permease
MEMMIYGNPQWITLMSAATAMIASTTGPFVTVPIARIQLKADVLSANCRKGMG